MGEFDIIEGLHNKRRVVTSLHTQNGCDQTPLKSDKTLSSGSWQFTNCDVKAPNQPAGIGCSQEGPNNSIGMGFNENGGGTYAAEWDPFAGHFRTWFWTSGNEPIDLKNTSSPQPHLWGTPYSYFRLSNDICPIKHFKNMRLVLNICLCGDLAGQFFNEQCPWYSNMTCPQFIASSPAGAYFIHEAFWNITRLDVYQKPRTPARSMKTD